MLPTEGGVEGAECFPDGAVLLEVQEMAGT